MGDADLRAAVLKMLMSRYADDSQTRIVEEMGIWSGSVRIDLAVINGEMHGYELKSARDTLRRLPAQAELYSQVFDKVTLILAERHQDAVRGKIPSWWGVTVARHAGKSVSFCTVKTAELNPAPSALQIARLLWRTEALSILSNYGADRGVKSRATEVLAARLVDTLGAKCLSYEVREVLKRRNGWLREPISN